MNIIIRTLNNRDHAAICEVAKQTWDGEDYLPKVAKDWILDGGFFGMEIDGKLIGTAKMTNLPNRVIWLEGLRIIPAFQKQGHGKALAEFVLKIALKLVKKGKADDIEFSTYYLNEESIKMAEKAGFEQVEKFYLLRHKPVESVISSTHYKLHPTLFEIFPSSLPWGWKFLHSNMKSIRFLNKRTYLYRHGDDRFYVGGEQPTVVLTTPAGKWVKECLPTMQYLVGEGMPIDIILPEHRKDELAVLGTIGFNTWKKNKEDIVVVYRYKK